MRLEAGVVRKLEVAREVSPHGFFLTDGEQDVLLHYSEKVGEVKPGDQVDVFIYHDTEDRLTATMKKPLLTLGEIALLEVADFHQRFGCFLEMGLGRNCCCRFASCRSCRSCVRRSATKYLSAWRMTVKGVLSRSSRRKRSCASFASRRRRIGKTAAWTRGYTRRCRWARSSFATAEC